MGVESTAGAGTTVTVTFPTVAGIDGDDHRDETAPVIPAADVKRVLIVDDEPTISAVREFGAASFRVSHHACDGCCWT